MTLRFNPTETSKRKALEEATKQLEDLLHSPFRQMHGDGYKTVSGSGYWHGKESLRMMALRHRYQQGEWNGALDRSENTGAGHILIPLRCSLSASHLRDMANFMRYAQGDPQLVAEFEAQAMNALVIGDVKSVYGEGLSSAYDLTTENRVHKQGYTYFYFDNDGSLCASPPPGVNIATPKPSRPARTGAVKK
jgi:hypothetical protein